MQQAADSLVRLSSREVVEDYGKEIEESTSSIKLPTWEGKATTFSVFWLRFKVYAVVKKFLLALQDGGEDNLPPDEATELDPEDDDDKL